MKKVVSFSGGRTSAYLCYLMIEQFGRENVDFIYMDTGAEHPKTYDFIRKCNEYFGLNLVCLRGDFNQQLGTGHSYKVFDADSIYHDLKPYAEMVEKYGTPGSSSAWCTSRMKQETHDKYCNDKYGKGGYETWLGIRSDEPSRLFNQFFASKLKNRGFPQVLFEDILRWANEGNMISKVRISSRGIDDILYDIKVSVTKNNVRYLAELGEIEKSDVLDFWSEMPFDLEIPEWLGNCVFCFKKSDLKIAAAAHDEPELYKEWVEMIEHSTEREGQQRSSRHVMYRKKRRIEQVVAMFDGSTGSEIKARIRGSKMIDTGSCSESCEVFNGDYDYDDDDDYDEPHYLTIFHNAAVLPVGESVLCDSDPSVYLGTPDSEAGSIKMWNVEHLRIVVSRGNLTTSSTE